MSMFAKIMVVVNFVLAVAFLAAAGTLLGAAEDYKYKYETAGKDWKDEKAKYEAQVSDFQNKLNDSSKRFTDLQTMKAAAEAQLKQLQDSNTATNAANTQLRGDLDKLSAAQKDLQEKLADLNKQIDSTRAELATSEAGRKEAMDKNKAQSDEIARLTQDKETAEKSLAAAATKSKSDAEQIDSLTTTVAMMKQSGGNTKSGAMAMSDVKGVVQAVDNKVDIYVLSVGSKDGVKAGYEFTIYRGSEYVSTIVIDKVFPNYSSGMTKPGTKKRDVMPGDEAATRL